MNAQSAFAPVLFSPELFKLNNICLLILCFKHFTVAFVVDIANSITFFPEKSLFEILYNIHGVASDERLKMRNKFVTCL